MKRTIPFDIELAKKGAKVMTRCGCNVRIGFFDLKNDEYPILGAVEDSSGREESIYSFTEDGKCAIIDDEHKDNEEDVFDLFIEVDDEIEEVELRLMTHQELSDWLRNCPEEHREFKYVGGSAVITSHDYYETETNTPADSILVRKNHGEWEKPLIEI